MFSSPREPRASRTARVVGAVLASVVLLAALVPVATAAGPGSARSAIVHLRKVGTTRMAASAAGTAGSSLFAATEIPNTDVLERTPKSSGSGSRGAVAAPNPATAPLASGNQGFFGFNALSHYDTRTADGGNAYSLEPPDQGLCVGNGYVVETINDVTAVYSAGGVLEAGPTSLNTFYGYPYAINRTTGVSGPFMTDPKCLYDASTDRFYMSELTLETDGAGNFTGTTHVDLAVSQSGDPTGLWTIFAFDTTNGDGSATGHPGCPCLGDQPLLGADANGIYVSTNEFSFFGSNFNGTQLYGISKTLLAAAANGGTPPAVWTENVGYQVPAPDGGTWYSLQPATSPSAGQFDTTNGGTEYFLSALDFFAQGDNRIAAWALTNTSSLDSLSNTNQPTLQAPVVLPSEPYVGPLTFGVNQQNGPRPLAVAIANAKATGGPRGHMPPLEQLNANDDRMNQVVYANGQLWAGLNTATGTPGTSAIAYFVVDPSWTSGSAFAPTIAGQSYVAVRGGSVLFPSIGVLPNGRATMAFTVSGHTMYPSVGYATVTAGGAGAVHIAAAGAGPEDGFTGYAAFGGGGIARWGDYSAAVADSAGNIWFAGEYIPGGTRTILANWGTFIGRVTP